uniref:Extended synaptotagmin 1 n=1 Tax=Calidris pygmaea TaxID=425635 RepID=A0A8C3K393_9CHAR
HRGSAHKGAGRAAAGPRPGSGSGGGGGGGMERRVPGLGALGALGRRLLWALPAYAAGLLGLGAGALVLAVALYAGWRRRRRVLAQAWPFFGQYMEKLLVENIAPSIRASNTHLQTFTFTKVDMGEKPLRVLGVRAHPGAHKKQILLDLNISYVGDVQIDVEVKKFFCKAGVKGMQLHGMLRIILEPLLGDVPIVGALTMFFIRRPTLDINWTGMTNLLDIPGLSSMSDTMIMDTISSYLVLPNRLLVPLVPDLHEAAQLRCPLPRGVVRVHLRAARDLRSKDRFMGGLVEGKSDPYAVLRVGTQVVTSRVIDNNLNPTWDEVYEVRHTLPTPPQNPPHRPPPPRPAGVVGRDPLCPPPRPCPSLTWLRLWGGRRGTLQKRLWGTWRSGRSWGAEWGGVVLESRRVGGPWQEGGAVGGCPCPVAPVPVSSPLRPQHVLRIHLLEAENLIAKDNFFKGVVRGRSDPYAKVRVAGRVFRSRVIKENLNPRWNEVYEVIVDNVPGQDVEFDLFDKDIDKDDFLGRWVLRGGHNGEGGKGGYGWLPLEEVKSGRLHVRLETLPPRPSAALLEQVLHNNSLLQPSRGEELSAALLSVFVDRAADLPLRKGSKPPAAFASLVVRDNSVKTKTCAPTTEPVWDEGFSFLIKRPHVESLELQVKEEGGQPLGALSLPLPQLLASEGLALDGWFPLAGGGPGSQVLLRAQLGVSDGLGGVGRR